MQTPQEMTLAQRHSKILQRIQSHTKSGKRSAELIAVSKLQPIEKIVEIHALGQQKFGENYAQELSEKAEALGHLDIYWVFIGHIQSNKIRKIVTHAQEIQTVASFSHAQQIARHAKDLGKAPFPIMLEVNAGDEASKSGSPLKEIKTLALQIVQELPELQLNGLMAIPPDSFSDSNYSTVPPLYHELRALADEIGLGLLSLGMSNDLSIALDAGSDMVRIGTAVFGSRDS
ncbi:MAG: YggS family pyridoxal phosphate-dependent enzyme [Oligoflexus sp.]|nr:YggS family pyridoxal phosphate-dependent enzyme [Oligoflexus sp.]